jgi:hypothetical protein
MLPTTAVAHLNDEGSRASVTGRRPIRQHRHACGWWMIAVTSYVLDRDSARHAARQRSRLADEKSRSDSAA